MKISKLGFLISLIISLLVGLFIGLSTEIKLFENRPYLADVPSAPEFQNVEIQFKNEVEEGCGKDSSQIGYIIKVTKFEYPDYEILFQEEKGSRSLISIDPNHLSNDQLQNFKSILSPGVKLKIQTESCGSGGFQDMLYLKTMRRVVF